MGDRRVLLIEDDPETNRLFSEVLSEDGFAVTACAHDGLPEPDGIALVVTDLDQGSRRYSSAGARDWIRLLRDRYAAPVFVITGHTEATLDDALRAEATDVMGKPIDLADLNVRLEAAYQRARN